MTKKAFLTQLTQRQFWIKTIISALIPLSIVLILFPRHNAYAIPLVLLAVIACGYFIRNISWSLPQTDHQWLVSTFVGYFLCFLLFVLYHQEGIRELDKPAKLLIFSIVILFLLRFPIRFHHLLIGFHLAALIVGGFSLYQILYLKLGRTHFPHMLIIQAGDIAMTLGLFNLFIAHYYHKNQKIFLLCIAVICGALGVYASFASGARGGWVCLPLLVIYVLYKLYQQLPLKHYLFLVAIILSGMLLTTQIPTVSKRIQYAITDIEQYQEGTKTTSTGYRFELWKSNLYAWKAKPIVGWSKTELRALQTQQEKDQLVTTGIVSNKFHAHNQFIEELSRRGLVGFGLFLTLLLIPFWVFSRYRHYSNSKAQLISQLGRLHIFLVATYCLTQSFFNHNSGMIFYALIITALYATLYPLTNQPTNEHA